MRLHLQLLRKHNSLTQSKHLEFDKSNNQPFKTVTNRHCWQVLPPMSFAEKELHRL